MTMTVRDEDVAQLTWMGFPEDHARNALRETGGNLEAAINGLLSGGDFGSTIASNPKVFSSLSEGASSSDSSDADSLVRGSTSQYTYGPDGRSACTCIALTVADMIANASTTDSDDTILTTDFLDRTIHEGVARYAKLRSAFASSSVEHLSADEVLRKDDERTASNASRIFDIQLSLAGGGESVRQGALSRDMDYPLGMKYVLKGLVDDIRIQRQQRYETSSNDADNRKNSNMHRSPMIFILITKSPETVLLCLPAVVDHTALQRTPNKQKYWLVDSHPRPQLFKGAEASYAKPHDTFESLLESIQQIFPYMDLGPDIPSMMADMYNMFDLYALEGRNTIHQSTNSDQSTNSARYWAGIPNLVRRFVRKRNGMPG